jgi:hypothetical protein
MTRATNRGWHGFRNGLVVSTYGDFTLSTSTTRSCTLPRGSAPLAVSLLCASLIAATPAAAATFFVTTNADSGAGSLREAITSANAAAGADTIVFNTTGTITLASPLPTLIESVELLGPGAELLVINANEDQRHFRFGGPSGSVYRIADLTLRNGFTADVGGSILVINNASLEVERCIIEDSRALAQGGGIAAFGPLDVIDSIIRANQSAFGGGVYVEGPGHRVRRSAVLLNSAEQGGGLYSGVGAELEVENVTLAGNFASTVTSDGFGGGISIAAGLTAISHVTIANNLADDGGGIALTGGALTTFANNILAYNQTWTEQPSNCLGNLPDNFGNMSSDGSCQLFGASDLENTDPLLLPLADNGGASPSMLPLPDSAAVNSALTGFCAARDQRDLMRPETGGGNCDRGSLEVYPEIDYQFEIFADGFE